MPKHMMKKILNPQLHSGFNNEIEVLLVPGGMIVYRTKFLSRESVTPVMTSTFVPWDKDADIEMAPGGLSKGTQYIRQWLYGDTLNEEE